MVVPLATSVKIDNTIEYLKRCFMATNLATYMLSNMLVRGTEVPDADWAGGLNRGGSNAPGIGINTGNADPKEQDWPRIADTGDRQSQHIGVGGAGRVLRVVQGDDITDRLAFVQADGPTNPGDPLDLTTGAVNLTGKIVDQDAWVWGVIPMA